MAEPQNLEKADANDEEIGDKGEKDQSMEITNNDDVGENNGKKNSENQESNPVVPESSSSSVLEDKIENSESKTEDATNSNSNINNDNNTNDKDDDNDINQPSNDNEDISLQGNKPADDENEENVDEGAEKEAVQMEDREYIKVTIKSQFQEKVVSVDAEANISQLKMSVAMSFNVLPEQVCLTLGGKMLNDDNENLKSLNIVEDTSLQMAVKYNLAEGQSDSSNSSSPWFLPSQYTKLGLNNVDFVALQQQMQQQMAANPEMVREMMGNPLVQQLMQNPQVMKKLISQVPQTREMLNKYPDIFDAINNPDVMKQSLEIARDPIAMQEMLDKMEIPENSPYVNAVPTFNPQSVPTPQTMLRMTAQHPELLQQMFKSPYYKSMVDGMIANPQWAQQMIVNNPLFVGNPQMQQQISSLMPYYLQQMQNPQLTALMQNPESLKALLKIQHGVSVLQSEVPNLSQSMGFPNLGIPGVANSNDNNSNMAANDYVGVARSNKDQLDATSIIFSQLVNQIGTGKIDLPDEEKYKDELGLMDSMGFHDVEVNMDLLKKSFGNVDAAVTYLIHQQQQQMSAT